MVADSCQQFCSQLSADLLSTVSSSALNCQQFCSQLSAVLLSVVSTHYLQDCESISLLIAYLHPLCIHHRDHVRLFGLQGLYAGYYRILTQSVCD